MVGIKKRSPTNKEFRTHFQDFASTQTKKGHLNNTSQKSKIGKETGVIIRILKDKIYENGWEVKVGTGNESKKYMCSIDSSILYMPKSTITDKYYIPEQKTEVEISIDTKSQIYSITKIKSTDTIPLALYDGVLTISTNTNTDTNSSVTSSIKLSDTSIDIISDKVQITDSNNNQVDLIDLHSQVITLSQEKEALWEKINKLEKQINGE